MLKMHETFFEVQDSLMKLGKLEFMAVMGTMFDTYCASHKDSNATEMAQEVADMVKQINEVLGGL